MVISFFFTVLSVNIAVLMDKLGTSSDFKLQLLDYYFFYGKWNGKYRDEQFKTDDCPRGCVYNSGIRFFIVVVFG